MGEGETGVKVILRDLGERGQILESELEILPRILGPVRSDEIDGLCAGWGRLWVVAWQRNLRSSPAGRALCRGTSWPLAALSNVRRRPRSFLARFPT